MRDKSEILQELSFVEKEKDDVLAWFDRATKRYQEDVKNWGKAEADSSELLSAKESLSNVTTKIEMLKWVLNK
jgi:hypothetical protein